MSSAAWSKIQATGAAEVCARYELSAEAKPQLVPGMSPRQFVDALVAAELLGDALQFLANALPKREAAWWACCCAREAEAVPEAAKEILAALDAAEAWARQPAEPARRAAGAAAEKAGMDHASSWAAMAAFWSGGSMAPPNVEPVPPGEGLTATAAFAAAVTAAKKKDPDKPMDRLRAMLALGDAVAAGTSGW